jgi:hypothetical protein
MKLYRVIDSGHRRCRILTGFDLVFVVGITTSIPRTSRLSTRRRKNVLRTRELVVVLTPNTTIDKNTRIFDCQEQTRFTKEG